MQQLSGQDAMFLHAELKGLPQHIGGVSIYRRPSRGPRVDFQAIHDLLQARLHRSPIFRRKLATVPLGLGQPYWQEDGNFDLEYHLRHIALPKPGDWRQLCILAARLHAVPLARDKPLWEIYVIEGLDAVEGLPPDCFALLLKVHHAAMDGATGARFMGVLHDRSPDAPPPAEPPPWIVDRPSALGMLGRAYLDSWRLPGKLWRMAGEMVPAVRRLQRGFAEHQFEHLGKLPHTRFQGTISPHRVVEAREFDFARLRAMKRAVPGATINDVMLTIVSGALRRYLEHHGELPLTSLATGCPVDVRGDADRDSGGNMVGFMILSLCSDIPDPRARLRTIHRKSLEAKAYAQALGPRIALDISELIPGSVLSVAVRAATLTGLAEKRVVMNTVVTNVPGPPFAQYLCGAELIRNLSLGPLFPGVGLFHIVYSTVQHGEGTVTLSFTACRQMLPDPAFYAQCLQDSHDELATALLQTPPRTAGRRRKKAVKR
jgi:diacylglycerol O-acyltransferase / wax synthase